MAEWPELAARALKEDSRGDWTGDALALYGVLLDNESHLHERLAQATRMHARSSQLGTCMSVLLPGQLRAEYAPRGVCRGVHWGSEGGWRALCGIWPHMGRPHERLTAHPRLASCTRHMPLSPQLSN